MHLKVIRHIAQGGFGSVDEVEDAKGNRYARKTFVKNPQLPPDMQQNVLSRFRKEVRIQKGIQSRNIVPVLGDDLNSDPPSYLMPVASSNLDADLANDRLLGGNMVAALTDIVLGLEELHSMQIYHRDLKTLNVLRFEDKNGSFYAIGDFGLISMKESRLSSLTKTGMKMGSDYYTAPEITKSLKSASVQSDVYSLGCILHDMVGTEDRVPCGEIREKGDFGPVLLGCTRKNPAQRFKTARAVLDAVISIGIPDSQPKTVKSIDFVSALQGTEPLNAEFWQRFAAYLEDEATHDERRAVCASLTAERIEEACQSALASAEIIAGQFSDWIKSSAFNFDSCDGLSLRLEAFFDHCNFEAKCACLLAMLELGTSHNRWYVERKFYRLCGPEMEPNLAKRLAVEFRISGPEVCRQIAHLESSISVNRANLHPELAKALAEICI